MANISFQKIAQKDVTKAGRNQQFIAVEPIQH
jgi:hypothetical protein